MEVEHMYFVDRSKIRETVEYIDDLLKVYNNDVSIESASGQLSLERLTHVLIEAIIDVGNMMIDGFIMRDPGSYEDIIDILIDEKVIPKDEESAYKEIIQLRKMLVADYLKVDHELLNNKLKTHLQTLQQFSSHILTYLNNELGVANAFSNEK